MYVTPRASKTTVKYRIMYVTLSQAASQTELFQEKQKPAVINKIMLRGSQMNCTRQKNMPRGDSIKLSKTEFHQYV